MFYFDYPSVGNKNLKTHQYEDPYKLIIISSSRESVSVNYKKMFKTHIALQEAIKLTFIALTCLLYQSRRNKINL